EQLRKQAKDLLRAWRAGDPTAVDRVAAHKPRATPPRLADAQLIIAREYGFESWPKLVHHVEGAGVEGLQPFEQLARDFADAHAGDLAALKRLNERLPGPDKDAAALRDVVQRTRQRMTGDGADGPFTLAEARALVAQRAGFGNWSNLAASVATSR